MSDHKLAEALREFEVHAAEIGLDLTRFEGIAAPWRSVETSRHWQTWRAAIAFKEAEQQAGEAQPVAWQERQEIRAGVFGEWYDRRIHWGLNRPQEMDSGGIRYQFRPLFTHPQQPLSEAEAASIFNAWREGPLWLHMTRGVEAAHKIGITKDTK